MYIYVCVCTTAQQVHGAPLGAEDISSIKQKLGMENKEGGFQIGQVCV
jgi:transketolase